MVCAQMGDLLLVILLSPILVLQVIWVRLRAARLQEAAGPRQGSAGQGPKLRVLVLGDSSGAGVGVATQDMALAGRLVARLASCYHVEWQLEAHCGDTTTTLLSRLNAMPDARFDLAVIAIGVNDVKNGMTRATWQRNYRTIIQTLTSRFEVQNIYASGVPPLGQFPLLPNPLRNLLGRRADAFDHDLHEIIAETDALCYVPMDFPDDPGLMAKDGFHPGPKVYDAWAARVATLIL